MDKTAIQAGAPPQKPEPDTSTAIQSTPPDSDASHLPRPNVAKPHPLALALKAVASLRVTVVLFVLSIILVFYGTLAQVDAGIWTVVGDYFRSGFVWIPLHVIFMRTIEPTSVSIPFPGGWLLGSLLMANLLAAHAIRFKVSLKRSGILLIHSGLIVLMLSELITGLYAIEGHMQIMEGGSSNFVEHSLYPEIAVIRPEVKKDDVVVIPTPMLTTGNVVQDEALPFDVEIDKYMVNSKLIHADPKIPNPATRGQGLDIQVQELEEGSGVDSDQKVDAASAYVTFKDKKSGAKLGTYLLSVLLDPQWVRVGDESYQVSLRFKRSYKDYTFHLQKFHHELHPHTNKPKEFKSDLRFVNPETKEDREVKIYMNHPYRYSGETFYQSGTVPDRMGRSVGTILQVVRNPGWLLPYISCVMVSLGMLIHFGINLGRFLENREAR